MKLFDLQINNIIDFPDSQLPTYAVISRPSFATQAAQSKWGVEIETERALRNQEWMAQAPLKMGELGIRYIWEASLCVDATSSAELDETNNSSFRRLQSCALCLAYLEGLPTTDLSNNQETWQQSSYWSDAWTLPELLLPSKVVFVDQEWNIRGTKPSPELLPLLSTLTKIPQSVLADPTTLPDMGVGVRISWAINRTARREEDVIYALAPILGVILAARYGEGKERAFLRLQEEVLQDTRDGSIFGWEPETPEEQIRGLLARAPAEFSKFLPYENEYQMGIQKHMGPWPWTGDVRFTSKGVHFQTGINDNGHLLMATIGEPTPGFPPFGPKINSALSLREWDGIYVRTVKSGYHSVVFGDNPQETVVVARDVDTRTAKQISAQFAAEDVRRDAEWWERRMSFKGTEHDDEELLLPSQNKSQMDDLPDTADLEAAKLVPLPPSPRLLTRRSKRVPESIEMTTERARILPKVFTDRYSSESEESDEDDSETLSDGADSDAWSDQGHDDYIKL